MQEDMGDPEFTRELLTGAVDNGVPLREALGDIIRGIGLKEFSASIGMSSGNVLRALRPGHDPRLGTLDRMLEPFGLRLGLALCERDQTVRRARRRRS